jgi:DNA topoisomerase-1
MNMVNSQMARRIIDRLVGFKMTPFLWKEFGLNKLSSGRVQTAVLKIIVDLAKQDPLYFIKASFSELFYGELNTNFSSFLEAKELLPMLFNAQYSIVESTIKKSKKKETPAPAFTTSTLQQAAFEKFGQGIEKTMEQAQELYECGMITYIRTNTPHMSASACKKLGANQDCDVTLDTAHEAIRPTFQEFELTKPECKRLYKLICDRALQSCGPSRVIIENEFQVQSNCGKFIFNCKTRKKALKKINADDLKIKEIKMVKNHESFTEGSLVSHLDAIGIGRPSTYVPILQRLYKQKYIKSVPNHEIIYEPLKEKKIRKHKVIIPTELGVKIVKFLDQHFTEIINVEFTKSMEMKLDEIENGALCFKSVIQDFWLRFDRLIKSCPCEVDTSSDCIQQDIQPSSSTFVYNINNLKYEVHTTRYGPVIEFLGEKKQYISLNSYLSLINKQIGDITKNDVAFLISFPKPMPQLPGCILHYGRYGFYIMDDNNQTITIPKEWFQGRDVFDVVNFQF